MYVCTLNKSLAMGLISHFPFPIFPFCATELLRYTHHSRWRDALEAVEGGASPWLGLCPGMRQWRLTSPVQLGMDPVPLIMPARHAEEIAKPTDRHSFPHRQKPNMIPNADFRRSSLATTTTFFS